MAGEPLQVVELTPAGRGAIATVLVVGAGAVEAVQSVFRPVPGGALGEREADRPVFGRFGPAPGEEVIVLRRDGGVVEICCHGGRAAVERVRRQMIAAGGKSVAWEEWVRASCGDPIVAEARIALAHAWTERAAWILLDQFHGALSRELAAIADLAEAGAIDDSARRLDELLALAPLGLHLVEPWRVVLAGRPNAGKSSLVNAILGYGRSIVHHEPGTTRDAVAAETALDGWPVELSDTAGLRTGGGAVETLGVEKTRRCLDAADLVVLVFDRSRPFSRDDAELAAEMPEALRVHNKADLPSAERERPTGLATSAVTGVGVQELIQEIADRLVPRVPPPGAGVPFASQQASLLATARDAIEAGALERACGVLQWLGTSDRRGRRDHAVGRTSYPPMFPRNRP